MRPNDELRVLAKDLHLQALLLAWGIKRLSERQASQHEHAVESIERDFSEFCSVHNQKADFRFDRGLTLIGVVYFLMVSGIEVTGRLSSPDQNIVKQEVDKKIGELFSLGRHNTVSIHSLSPLSKKTQVDTWTLAKRLRNSLSHARYEYRPTRGVVCFEDYDQRGNLTARFEMSAFNVYNFAYKFALGLLSANERINASP